MRWSRFACSLLHMFGILTFACGLLLLSPRVAHAEVVDLIDGSVWFRPLNRTYSTNADLTDSEDTFRQYLVNNLSVDGLIRGTWTNNMWESSKQYNTVSGSTVQYQSSNLIYDYYGFNVNTSMTTWASRPVCYVMVDKTASPVPAGSMLIFNGFQDAWELFKYPDSTTVLYSPSQRAAADYVSLWASPNGYYGDAVLCPYDAESGFYTVPVAAKYIYLVFRLDSTNPYAGYGVSFRYPDRLHLWWDVVDASTVAQIRNDNQNTDKLMDTEGSDTVAGDVSEDAIEQVDNLDIMQTYHELTDEFQQQLSTQESDTTVPFPGLNLLGFSIPAMEVDVWQYSPIPQSTVRNFLTFIFCVAFLHHIYALIQAIFGIYEYGVGVEDFGMGSYDMGPRPVVWRGADYSVDEDLGF